MILFAKHLALMSVALFLAPVVARLFAKAAGRANRMARPGLGLVFLLSRAGLALVVPLLAQALFAVLWDRWFGAEWVRYAALGIAGAFYGLGFGDAQDFPRLPAAVWGALGGLGTAALYVFLPQNGEGRALCVALFAALPVLAYRPYATRGLRRIGGRGLIVPNRRTVG